MLQLHHVNVEFVFSVNIIAASLYRPVIKIKDVSGQYKSTI